MNEDAKRAILDPEADGDLKRLATAIKRNAEALTADLEEVEKQAILKALEETRWNRTAAAEKLGISFRQIRHRLKKFGIE